LISKYPDKRLHERGFVKAVEIFIFTLGGKSKVLYKEQYLIHSEEIILKSYIFAEYDGNGR